MKGIVFREFIDMVENEFSLEIADQIISASSLSTGGAYTAVGTYPHEEMVQLVSHLSELTGQPVPALLQHFGRLLFRRFAAIHPQYATSHTSVFSLLRELDGNIHAEVHKLYNDVELPSFTYEVLDENRMVFHYTSHRALADFAQGMIEGCIAYFGEPMQVEREDLPPDSEGAHARFTLTRSLHEQPG